jgi:hypothetical protein
MNQSTIISLKSKIYIILLLLLLFIIIINSQIVTKQQIILNDPALVSCNTGQTNVKSREFTILAFKINEIRKGEKYLNMMMYSHDKNQAPVIFNISGEKRVEAFIAFYGSE